MAGCRGEAGLCLGGPRGGHLSSLPASPLCRRGTSLRPQLRLALDRLWVLSGGAEAEGEEAEEEDGSGEGSNSLILAWPTGSCLATFE